MASHTLPTLSLYFSQNYCCNNYCHNYFLLLLLVLIIILIDSIDYFERFILDICIVHIDTMCCFIINSNYDVTSMMMQPMIPMRQQLQVSLAVVAAEVQTATISISMSMTLVLVMVLPVYHPTTDHHDPRHHLLNDSFRSTGVDLLEASVVKSKSTSDPYIYFKMLHML